MKLTFLGTSHGIPSADRFCSCTLLEVGDDAYFIDMGAPGVDLLLRAGRTPEAVRAIFATHAHGDHTNGILSYADLLNWAYPKASCDIWLTETGQINAMKDLIAFSSSHPDEERVRFRLMTPETVYRDGRLTLTPIPTAHMGEGHPTYAYLVEAEGKKVLFSGDLSVNLAADDFPKAALEEPLDLMMLECAHFSADQVKPYLQRCTARQVLFTHVYPVEKIPQLAALDGQFACRVGTVADGDTVEL